MNIGFKLQLTKLWHRCLASYIRGIGVGFGTLSFAGAVAPRALALGIIAQLGTAAFGALAGPIQVFLSEASNLLDGGADPAPAPPG